MAACARCYCTSKLTHHMLYTCLPALDLMPQATAAPLSANEAGKVDFENARREF